jgi:hypothetical protein
LITLADMGRPKKVISDEERRARALEGKQAQRERARQQTIITGRSGADPEFPRQRAARIINIHPSNS